MTMSSYREAQTLSMLWDATSRIDLHIIVIATGLETSSPSTLLASQV